MIAALAAVMLARPWARTALYWGAVSLAIMLFLLSLWRAGERAWRMADGGWRMADGGWRSVSKPRRRSTTSNPRCRKRRLAALAIATSWLAACATGIPEPDLAVCPPVAEYSPDFQTRAADELALLSDESALAEMLSDYAVMREQARACASERSAPVKHPLRQRGNRIDPVSAPSVAIRLEVAIMIIRT